jgi:energy-coupling factor transporter ATP-binding protein EcfA2
MNAQAILEAAKVIGLKLPPDLLSAYYTALKTKGFVLLTGVSGTGKTKLAMAFAELFGDEEEGACFVAVRPDWRDSRGLLGYWNPMENIYESTPFLRALLRAAQEFGEPSAPPFDGFTAASAETLEDALKRWLNDKSVQAWMANYRAFVQQVKATPVLHPAFPLHDLWHPQKNAVAHVGAAPTLQVTDEELKHVTEILANTNQAVGERLVAAMRAFEQLPISERPWARTLRALAALDPEHATVLLKSRDLRAALRALGYEQGFSLTYSTERGHAQKITDAFAFLQTQLRQLLKRIGQQDDAVLRSVCAWLTHRWAWSQSAEVEHARPDVSGVFVILDEMNLARVEHYFSDFLSALESGRRDDGWTQQAIVLHHQQTAVPDRSGAPIPSTLRLPPNLYITGTVNVDETTYPFSPKVLDRAFTLEFSEVSFTDYPPTPNASRREAWDLLREEARAYLSSTFVVPPSGGRFVLREQQAQYGNSVNPFLDFANFGRFLGWTEEEKKQRVAGFLLQHPHFRDHLENLKTLLAPHNLHFGYRVFDEIILFLINAQSPIVFDGFGSLDAAFDCAVHAKVLPKFHGSRAKLEEPLVKVRLWCETPDNVDAVMQGCRDTMNALRKGEMREAHLVYPRTASKCQRMLREVYETGFASFA